MFFVEIFDHDKFKRVVGGGVSVKATQMVAFKDVKHVYPGEKLSFVKNRHKGEDPVSYAVMSNGLSYCIRAGEDERE